MTQPEAQGDFFEASAAPGRLSVIEMPSLAEGPSSGTFQRGGLRKRDAQGGELGVIDSTGSGVPPSIGRVTW